MVKILKCEEVNPACNFEAVGDSDEEVLQNAAEHARIVHNIRKISPEGLQKARSAIREESESKQYASGSN